ncbi:MAG: hypothetical protein ACLP7I_05925, partial [Limisphaerales bacterium]
REVNVAPVLPTIAPQTVAELNLLTVTNTAGEPNNHATTTGYGLVNAPLGMSISASGIISWTPAQDQSPSTNVITTVVTNSDPYDLVNPVLTATNSFTVVVREVNVAPVLPTIPPQTVNGQSLMTVTNTATEPNQHATTTGYGLVNAPLGMSISANGIITWTPAVNQVPSINVITTVVTNSDPYDLVNPQLTATNSFTVTVQPIYNGPVLPAQTNLVVNELALLTVTNTAIDTDIPQLALTYQLINPPAGASISTNGIITWTPSQAQSPGTYTISTVVTDSGVPALAATNSFVVTVTVLSNDFRIVSMTISNEVATITWTSVAGNYYRLLHSGNLANTNWTAVAPDILATGPLTTTTNFIGNAPGQFYRVELVTYQSLPQPVIQSLMITNNTIIIKWSAVAGHLYRLQSKNNLNDAVWTDVLPDVTATGATTTTTNIIGTATQRFFRIWLRS